MNDILGPQTLWVIVAVLVVAVIAAKLLMDALFD
jgi:hypothetical protein